MTTTQEHPHNNKKCPKCGGHVQLGFGMLGGGCGPYAFCTNVSCTWFAKKGESK